ncbi:hypothetical protein D3C75_1055320 [compost metagenome]
MGFVRVLLTQLPAYFIQAHEHMTAHEHPSHEPGEHQAGAQHDQYPLLAAIRGLDQALHGFAIVFGVGVRLRTGHRNQDLGLVLELLIEALQDVVLIDERLAQGEEIRRLHINVG